MVLFCKKELLACLTLTVAACTSAGQQGCVEARATDIPLRFDGSQLIATPLLNGQPTSMIFDTGAQVTALTKDAADRLSLHLQPLPGTMEGIGGLSGVFGFQADTYQIGRLHGRHLALLASDMALSSPETSVDGLLGVDFLSNYDLDLDLADRRASLFRVVSGCGSPSTVLDGSLYTIPLTSPDPDDPRPHVNVEIGGKTLRALIDTGADGTAIFRHAASRLGLRIDELTADPHFRSTGTGPRARAAVLHVMAPISIGDLTIQNLPVAIIDQSSLSGTDMLIGLDFLFRVHAWISFSSHTLILQSPPRPSPPAQP